MSIIPKISVGLPKKREKFPLNFDNSTTANIGTIQPTMCREMVPQEKFSVKVSSLVRLASMPLPTFGRLSLRHNHVFVPYEDLYQPFEAMLSQQHYTSAVSTFIPTKVPYFKFDKELLSMIVAYSDITITPKNMMNDPLIIERSYAPALNSDHDPIGKMLAIQANDNAVTNYSVMYHQLKKIQTAVNAIRGAASWFDGAYTVNHDGNIYQKFYPYGAGSLKQDDYGVLRCGDFYISFGGLTGNANASFDFEYITLSNNEYSVHEGNVKYDPSGFAITPESADLITTVGDYNLLFKFKAPLKRLRTIFIGLGYQFSPYAYQVEFNVLKLLAYYKGWFSLFRPDREKAFVDTNCYKLIKWFSERNGTLAGSAPSQSDTSATLWRNFLKDLMNDCYYYLPMDYFGMSQKSPVNQQEKTEFKLPLGSVENNQLTGNAAAVISNNESGSQNGWQNVIGAHSGNASALPPEWVYTNPVVQRLVQRLLTFSNKNTVIGRSIRNYLKVHYGIEDVDTIDSGGVIRIGGSRVNINISDVMSTAENKEGFLGEYGGKGLGYGDSESFDYTASKFGVWITYTLIVPESGYFQGYLLENRHLDRYQFFMPEFDALGYQVLERGEVMDSYDCDGNGWSPSAYDRTRAFGLVPRYSEYKVGRNIVNGDLSLIGLKNSMSPYTLDRRIPSGLYTAPILKYACMYNKWDAVTEEGIGFESEVGGEGIVQPAFVPSVVYDDFRRIDPTDHLGQYNRIFNYGLNDLDHFIIHNIFSVVAVAPMKSLTRSFDTYGEEDEASISIEKA